MIKDIIVYQLTHSILIPPAVSGSRTQYPIRQAYDSTIHKSQRQTMKKIVIDLGDTE